MIPEIKNRIEQIQQGKLPTDYKETNAGIVPVDWTEVCLGDIYIERKEAGNDMLPLLMVSIHSGVSDGEVDEESLPKKVKRIEDKSQYKRAAVGDLVFNMMRAWQGAVGTVYTEGMVSPAYIVAKPIGLANSQFMNYYMKTSRMVYAMRRQSYGVTDFRLRLYWDSFTPIQCVLPPIKEQQKIAEILTVQDKIIELKEKLITEKQQQKKYLMQQLLSGRKRLPEFNNEWKKVQFNDVLAFGSTNTFSRDNMQKDAAGVRNIHYGDIFVKYHEVLDGSCNIIPSLVPEASRKVKEYVSNGDIIIADTAEDTTAGKTIEIQNIGATKMVAGLHTMLCRPICDYFVSGWLGYFMNSEYYHNQLIPYIAGVKVMSISKQNIIKTHLLVPTKQEQKEIVSLLSAANEEINLLQQSLEQERQKKKALMQLLLTGIVRVNV